MIIALGVLFILGNLLAALGVVPITTQALAILNGVGWLLAMILGVFPIPWPWVRPAQ